MEIARIPIRRRKTAPGAELPPGPRRPPVLQLLAWTRAPVDLLESCSGRYGHRFTLRFPGPRRCVVLSDPEDARRVLTAPPASLLPEPTSAPATLAPLLTHERVDDYRELVRELTREHVGSWPIRRTFPVLEPMRVLVRRIVRCAAPGAKLADVQLERTAAALAFAFRWILGTPEVREKVREESRDDPAGRIPYTTAAVCEALRLTPILPVLSRWAAEPFLLEGLAIPRGTYVAPCVYLLQRDPRLFPQPDFYRPERFLERVPELCQMVPIGGLNGLCSGNPAARCEVPVIVCTALAHVELALPCGRIPPLRRRGAILVPADGTPVRVERARTPRP